MMPLPYRVTGRRQETSDTATLILEPVRQPMAAARPGQFSMVYAFGVGEVPISVSGPPDADLVVHTLRAVGAVTRALHDARVGQVLGLRGPYGTDWGLPVPVGSDLVIVGGGIGLAPLRPAVYHALDQRARYRRVAVLIGARTPDDLLFTKEYDDWRAGGVEVGVTVDRADTTWAGRVGVVPDLITGLEFAPESTVALVCGPEVMMRFTARALLRRGVPPAAVRVSLERNMHCGTALCGHCQLGPLLLCRDGPVVGYDRAQPLTGVKEL
ncbi:oxidoreductase [Planosporangium thailandense]|uniref:Oxidoreductase n=1 Tax=Planosporangium thailandense TaxID=765197 RepID=A0ABX0Y274_9ACTN|nr:FAD/NAD(P)-binding protein [Planosporangium thailandense]NJC72456.1 oxidoreductase [Planosporangium thailandense]